MFRRKKKIDKLSNLHPMAGLVTESDVQDFLRLDPKDRFAALARCRQRAAFFGGTVPVTAFVLGLTLIGAAFAGLAGDLQAVGRLSVSLLLLVAGMVFCKLLLIWGQWGAEYVARAEAYSSAIEDQDKAYRHAELLAAVNNGNGRGSGLGLLARLGL